MRRLLTTRRLAAAVLVAAAIALTMFGDAASAQERPRSGIDVVQVQGLLDPSNARTG